MAGYKYTILFCAFLCACGSEDSTSQQLGDHYDAEYQGLRVRYGSASNPSPEFLYAVWTQVQECIGAIAEPPLVIYIDDASKICDGYDPAGCVFLASGKIVIENWIATTPNSATASFAHEAVHWITHYNGLLEVYQQYNHDSNLFIDCAAPPKITVPIL